MTKIATVRMAKDGEWDAAYEACPHATYFHSREWAEAWHHTTGGRVRPWPRLLQFEDGTQVVLPLSVQAGARGLVKSCVSSPAGTYGGWISEQPLIEGHTEALGAYMIYGFKRLDWRLNPFDEEALRFVPARRRRDDETQVLDLRPGFQKVHRGWSKGHRAAATQARKAGVEVRLANRPEDWQDYYAIYQDSVERWGEQATSHHPKELFEHLAQLDTEHVRLWLAECRGTLAAGALCLHGPDHVSYWHGAALESHFSQRPVHLLMYEAIKDACERGITWFDFNPSGGHEGVWDFKKGFGAQAMSAPVVRIRPLWRRLAGGVVGKLGQLKRLRGAAAPETGPATQADPAAIG